LNTMRKRSRKLWRLRGKRHSLPLRTAKKLSG
jgi:hypothetical protein